jgi:hypothetical protein
LSAPAPRTTTARKVKKVRNPGLHRRMGRTAAKRPKSCLLFLNVIPDNRLSLCCDAPCQRDPPMSKSLAFATASHPARHAAASLGDVSRGIAVGRGLSGVLLSHRRGALHPRRPQKGSGKCGNPLRCRFDRCFCGAVPGCLRLAETCGKSPTKLWRPFHR